MADEPDCQDVAGFEAMRDERSTELTYAVSPSEQMHYSFCVFARRP
jgi:hypothetical protein